MTDTTSTMTVAQAQQKRAELMSDPEWSKRYVNGSKKELAEMTEISRVISGVTTQSQS